VSDRAELAKLLALLWHDALLEEHLREIDEVLEKGVDETLPMAILVAEDDNDALIGFPSSDGRMSL
jgi:hypothetical protein